MFKAFGLETHIECMIIDDDSKKHYIYRFQEEEYFKAQSINQPTPPTLLNELREKYDKQAIEFAEWVDFNATQKSEGLWYSSVLSIKIADAISTAELFELFKKSKL